MPINDPPPLKPLRLDGLGPFETPEAEACLGLVIAQGELPPRISLIVQGGKELRIPASQPVLEKLRDMLNKLLPPPKDDATNQG